MFRQALMASLNNPAVSGATIYTAEVPHGVCLPPGKLKSEVDKGCIVRSIFQNFSLPPL